jgi:glutaminase
MAFQEKHQEKNQSMDLSGVIEKIHQHYAPLMVGQLASYIPELARVQPSLFSIAITTVSGQTFSIGDVGFRFTLQSVSKPFVYGLASQQIGRVELHKKIGVEPSGEAFNSIVELEKVTHRPYNPMINSGAIAVTSLLLPSEEKARFEKILKLFGEMSGHPHEVDEAVFHSERSTAHRNRSIAHLMRHFDVIEGDIDASLDIYFRQCSILADVVDLSMMAATLANGGVQPKSNISIFKRETVRDMLSLMFTCGMYDSAGEWAFEVGLPAKSGVSGGVIAVVPGKMGIAVFSPLIDSRGHSCRGVEVIKELSNELGLGIFSESK